MAVIAAVAASSTTAALATIAAAAVATSAACHAATGVTATGSIVIFTSGIAANTRTGHFSFNDCYRPSSVSWRYLCQRRSYTERIFNIIHVPEVFLYIIGVDSLRITYNLRTPSSDKGRERERPKHGASPIVDLAFSLTSVEESSLRYSTIQSLFRVLRRPNTCS